jgi:glycosyltransferase involved in cell wall biosynthesis
MKIAYVTADHGTPVFGSKGASIHIQSLVEAFCDLGHEPRLLAARVGEAPPGYPVPVRKVYPGPAPAAAPESSDAERARREAKERRCLAIAAATEEALVSLHREWPFDLIYERYSLWSAAGVRASKRLGVPCVMEVNAPLCQEQATYRKLVLAAVAECIEREVMTGAQLLVAVSDSVRRHVLSCGARAEQAVEIANGVRLDQFHPAVAARAPVDLAGRFVVGFTGSLKPWHGTDVLLDGFKLLRLQVPEAHLLIVGEGPMRIWMEGYARGAGIEDAVSFTGWAPYADLPGIVQSMDVAVAPYPPLTDFYFSPLKLYEYLAMGKPVVASAVGQVQELISDGHDGLLAPPGDAGALARRLIELHADPELRARLGRQAAATAAAHGWDERAREILRRSQRLGLAAEGRRRVTGPPRGSPRQ